MGRDEDEEKSSYHIFRGNCAKSIFQLRESEQS